MILLEAERAKEGREAVVGSDSSHAILSGRSCFLLLARSTPFGEPAREHLPSDVISHFRTPQGRLALFQMV